MKVLLITDVPPSKAFSGALFTDRLCNFLNKDSLAAYIIINPALRDTPVSPDCEWIPMEFCMKPNESGILTLFKKYGYLFSLFSEIFTLIKETYISIFRITGIISKICRFGKKHQVDRVWCILQGQTMIRIALGSAKKLRIPLYTQVWDPPQWWLNSNSIDSITKSRVMKLFGKTLSNSRNVAAASFNMARIYRERYNTGTVPVIPSLHPSAVLTPDVSIINNDRLIISIAGQIYALDAWNSLLKALDSVGWSINSKSVTIRIMSYYLPNIPGHTAKNIEFLGYREQTESIKILSESDILYMPYWFDKDYDEVVRLSFPSKLTSYFAAGKPILCHAPEYSSPSAFIVDYHAGLVCPSLDIKDIIAAIVNIDKDKELVEELTVNGREALAKHLSDKNLKIKFSEFLEIEPSLLRYE